MVELRFVVPANTSTEPPRLQYRVHEPCVDIGGILTEGDWTGWLEVPIVVELKQRTAEVPNAKVTGWPSTDSAKEKEHE